MRKYERSLRRLAKNFGYIVTQRKKHFILSPEQGGGPKLSASVSPSDHRAIKNIECDLKKAITGYETET